MRRDVEGKARVSLSKTMLYVDAGFIHPTYLDEVLSNLTQDAANTKKNGTQERTGTRSLIVEAILKVRRLLGPSLGNT